ncbi:hypothetical protein DL98DRAFT_629814 [Cadophora sp. DSE1049]|nr:hypothetical protein DL98DRAFT_629814 [Cadophora sp. DSE1049]
MASTVPPEMPSEATIESLRGELEGNVFRGIEGFCNKYFEGKSWTATATKTTSTSQISRKLGAELLNVTDFKGLLNWVGAVQSQLLNIDAARLAFDMKPITGPDLPFQASIYLSRVCKSEGSSDVPRSAGNTCVFSECHSNDVAVMAEDSLEFLHFCERCYSSEKINLSRTPDLLIKILASYSQMSEEELGFNTFIQGLELGTDPYVTFAQGEKLYLSKMIATPSQIVGPGTTCYAASTTTKGQPSTVVKFSWRDDNDESQGEVEMLKRAHKRKVQGVVQLVGNQDLTTITSLRHGLKFPQPFMNRTFSCVATTPLGRLLQTYSSIPELLLILCDLVKAIKSLHLDGRMLHRDIAIKNTIIPMQQSADSLKGVLIDFDQALDLDSVGSDQSMIGSDGYMAIGILPGKRHTYRHDLESLFYMFLWLAIVNDRVHDDIYDILEGMPKESRLRAWCSMDFYSVRQAKMADMGPEGFPRILDEFSADFASLRGLAEDLHALLFPLRDGKIFIGTETSEAAIEKLYSGMADAFKQSALKFQK